MTLSARSRPQALAATAIPGRVRFRFASWLRGWVAARWRGLVRGRVLPAAVSARLERGERVLSVAEAPDGGCALVASDRALYHRGLPHRTGTDGWSRLGWEEVDRIDWDAAAGQLAITGLTGVAPPRTAIPMRQRGTVPELIQERVTHTRLGRWRLLVAGAHHVLVEARRRPVTGEVLWFVLSGPGDLDTGARVERAITRLCAELGVMPQSGTSLSLSQALGEPATWPA